jgi:uncharacterized OB-fold protein
MIEMTSVLPVQDELSKAWFEAAKEGKLLLQRDPVTKKVQMYPRAHVLGALGRTPEWVEASGKGKLHSYTTVHRSVHREFASMTPFVIALIDLEEGARVTSWVVDTPIDQLRCDMPVKAVFREIHPDVVMPCFTGE